MIRRMAATQTAAPPDVPFVTSLRHFAGDIKLAHSVFALPFALLAAVMAGQGQPAGVLAVKLSLVVVCMVLARTLAMGANRLLDANLDAQNPRTAARAIPGGRLQRRFVLAAVGACAAAFVVVTSAFGYFFGNWLPLVLAGPVLLFLAAYPLLKRFTSLCHYYLGAALALAPVCAFVAVDGATPPAAWLLFGAVLCWTAGFDILYATQDYAADRRLGVYSLPAGIGIGRALWVSRLTHVAAVAFLGGVGWVRPELGALWFAATGLAAVLLTVEQSLVRADDLSRLNLAFFTLNGVVSLVVGGLGIADVLL